MSDSSFLAHLFTEDIYVIKGDELTDAPAQVAKEEAIQAAPKAEPVVEASTVASEANTAVEQPVAPVEKKPVAPVAQETPIESPAPEPSVKQETEESPALFEPLKAEEPEPVYLKPLPTEGNNLKHCLVLVESDEAVLEANLKGLLEKIMGAVKRSMEDILLVNIKAASEEQLEALLSEQNHRHLLAFGTSGVEALSEVGHYELAQVNRKHYLKAHSLRAISENIEHKKALWKALKEMF